MRRILFLLTGLVLVLSSCRQVYIMDFPIGDDDQTESSSVYTAATIDDVRSLLGRIEDGAVIDFGDMAIPADVEPVVISKDLAFKGSIRISEISSGRIVQNGGGASLFIITDEGSLGFDSSFSIKVGAGISSLDSVFSVSGTIDTTALVPIVGDNPIPMIFVATDAGTGCIEGQIADGISIEIDEGNPYKNSIESSIANRNPDAVVSRIPMPVFIDDSVLSSISNIASRSPSDESWQDEYANAMKVMYSMQIPPVTGFVSETISRQYEDTVFGFHLMVSVSYRDGEFIFTGLSDELAIEVAYSPIDMSYDYILINKLENPLDTDDDRMDMDYYTVAIGEGIEYDPGIGSWNGDVTGYIQIRQPETSPDPYTYTLTRSLFHSDSTVSGIATYASSYNKNIDVPGFSDSIVSISEGRSFIDNLSSADGWSEEGPYYELLYYLPEEHTYNIFYDADQDSDDLIAAAAEISSNWVPEIPGI